jgi:hypothetical protein
MLVPQDLGVTNTKAWLATRCHNADRMASEPPGVRSPCEGVYKLPSFDIGVHSFSLFADASEFVHVYSEWQRSTTYVGRVAEEVHKWRLTATNIALYFST